VWFDDSKCPTRLSRWWKKQEQLVCFDDLPRIFQNAKYARKRVCVFWSREAVKLGLQSAEAGLYMTCLASLNQMVSWFLLNDAFCKLLSVHQMNMGR
jgi:hypothetical protein